jgi:hypothetical protein
MSYGGANITYVSMLGHTLILSNTNITDVLMLGHTLDLRWCKNISKYQIIELNKQLKI